MSDILDRISRVEATPFHDPAGWEELWRVLQDARAEITRLRAEVKKLDPLAAICNRREWRAAAGTDNGAP